MSYTPPIFATDGLAVPSPLLIVPGGGSDGTNAHVVATDTSGRQKVLLYDSYSADAANVAFRADKMKVAGFTLSVTPLTILTGATKYFIQSVNIIFDPASSRAAAATLALTLQDTVDGALFSFLTYFPAAPTLPVIVTTISQNFPFFYKSSTAGSSFQVVANGSITAGTITLNVNYGLTSL